MAPNNDGKVDPPERAADVGEQRKKMVGRVKELAEEARVACRNIRRDANKQFDQEEETRC